MPVKVKFVSKDGESLYTIEGGQVTQDSGPVIPTLVDVMQVVIESHNPMKYVPVWDNEYAEEIARQFPRLIEVVELEKVVSEPGVIY